MDYDTIYNHARTLLKQHGKPDHSGYTGDRVVLWIGEQPRFTKTVATVKGHDDAIISAAAKAIYPECDFILIAGGNTEIGMHRDATYAHADAVTFNLGGQAYFEHEDHDPVRLEHGDVTKFNCKRLHGVLEADLDRIVIALWRRNPKWV